MTKPEVKEARRYLFAQNARYQSGVFTPVPLSEWPNNVTLKPSSVMRSKEFLVQIFCGEVTRLSICRTDLDDSGRFKDMITWDELQSIKKGVGYGDSDAVECFPRDEDVVNVANMRHLWILPSVMTGFFWRKAR